MGTFFVLNGKSSNKIYEKAETKYKSYLGPGENFVGTVYDTP